MKTITEIEALLNRVGPARISLDDAKIAATELREFARSISWVGPLTKPGTVELTPEFKAHLASKI